MAEEIALAVGDLVSSLREIVGDDPYLHDAAGKIALRDLAHAAVDDLGMLRDDVADHLSIMESVIREKDDEAAPEEPG